MAAIGILPLTLLMIAGMAVLGLIATWFTRWCIQSGLERQK